MSEVQQVKITKLAQCPCGNKGIYLEAPRGIGLANLGLTSLLFGEPIIKRDSNVMAQCTACKKYCRTDVLAYYGLPKFSTFELMQSKPEYIVAMGKHLGIHREAMMWFMECIRTGNLLQAEDLPERKIGTLGVMPFTKLPNAVRFQNDKMDMILARYDENLWSLMGILKE